MNTPVFHKFSLAACRAAGIDPSYVLPFKAGDYWMVVADAVYENKPVSYVTVTAGDFVHVPIARYLTNRDPADTLAFVASVGVAVGYQFDGRGDELHVVYGDIVEELLMPDGSPAFGVYLGFAVRN